MKTRYGFSMYNLKLTVNRPMQNMPEIKKDGWWRKDHTRIFSDAVVFEWDYRSEHSTLTQYNCVLPKDMIGLSNEEIIE